MSPLRPRHRTRRGRSILLTRAHVRVAAELGAGVMVLTDGADPGGHERAAEDHPGVPEQPGRLLICATNFIRSLDAAFVRHGRFEYVIPVGLPDDQARSAIGERYIPESAVRVDVAQLVSMSEGFSPHSRGLWSFVGKV